MGLLGRLLRNFHADEAKLTMVIVAAGKPNSITLTSSAFENKQPLDKRFAGKGVSPPLQWSNVPEGTKEFALVIEDVDSPFVKPFVHCVAINIDAAARSFEEGELTRYRGPRPIKGHGPHKYIFQLFALDTKLNLTPEMKPEEVQAALTGHVLAVGSLVGTYERP